MPTRLRLALLAALALPWASPALAAPCAPGTLTAYVALGAGGCTLGPASFGDFSDLGAPFGATPISPDAVQVIPLAPDPSSAQLVFQVNAAASAQQLLEILIGYSVTAPLLKRAQLTLEGSSVTQDGAVTAIEDLCLAGSFGPGGPTGCSGTPETLIVFDAAVDRDLFAGMSFAAVGSLAVVHDIAVDGGLLGTAALTSATNEFRVPEPAAATLLVAAGGLALWLRRRRRA